MAWISSSWWSRVELRRPRRLSLIRTALGGACLAAAFGLPAAGWWVLGGGGALDRTWDALERPLVDLQANIAEIGRGAERIDPTKVAETADQLRRTSGLWLDVARRTDLDLRAVRETRTAVDGIADGLDGMRARLRPEQVRSLAEAFKGTARLLRETVVPSARESATLLAANRQEIRAGAVALAATVEEVAFDLDDLKQANAFLVQLDQAAKVTAEELARVDLGAVENGLDGTGRVLETIAGNLDQARAWTVPRNFRMNGWTPTWDLVPIMPSAVQAAADLRGIAENLKPVRESVGRTKQALPQIVRVLEGSRGTLKIMSDRLEKLLRRDKELQAVLKRVPAQLAAAAKTIPDLLDRTATALANAEGLIAAANALDQAATGLDDSAGDWERTDRSLGGTVTVLRITAKQLSELEANEPQLRRAREESLALAEQLTKSLTELQPQFVAGVAAGRTNLRVTAAGLEGWSRTVRESREPVRWSLALLGLAGAAAFGAIGLLVLSDAVRIRRTS